MRFVDRSSVDVPSYLRSREIQFSRQKLLEFLRLKPRERAQTRVPFRPLRPNDSVMDALFRLFNNKCAFCEGETPLRLYQLRPPRNTGPGGLTNPEKRLYYCWLTDAWQNQYPICDGCHPKREGHFPVFGERAPVPTAEEFEVFCTSNEGTWPAYPINEEPILLDPCQDTDLQDHLVLLQDGRLKAETHRGTETIETFNLNRRDLVGRRAEAWRAPPDFTFHITGKIPEFHGLRRAPGNRRSPTEAPEPETPAVAADQARPATQDTVAAANAATATVAPAPRALSLTRVSLRNFKAVETLDIEVPDWPKDPECAKAMLVLGENAAGKSSILEGIALAALSDEARHDLNEPPAKYLLNPAFMGAQDLKQRDSGSVVLTFSDGSTRRLEIGPTGFDLTATDANPVLPVFAYGAYRHFVSAQQDWREARPVLSLFKSDDLLSNPQVWLLDLPEEAFLEVIGVLRVVFGVDPQFNVIEADRIANICYVVSELEDERQRRTPLDSVSSGFRTILALCCDLMRWASDMKDKVDFDGDFTNFPGILLIDEVEAHLHPRWKIQIMNGLRKAFPAMTIIATTHDPLCLRGMYDKEVKVLRRILTKATGQKLPTMVESVIDLPDVSRLTVEQLLTSDLFSLVSTDDDRGDNDIAGLADYLAKIDTGEKPTEEGIKAWNRLYEEISGALPIGRGEGARFVQKAVAKYLVKRPTLSAAAQKALKAKTDEDILKALEGLI